MKNLQWQNEAIGAKLIWRLYNERDRKWAKILYNKYLNVDDPLLIFRVINPPKGSKSWNFMIRCHKLICNHLTWDVGKGDEALFWEASWDGQPPLLQRNISLNFKNKLIDL